MSKVVAPPEETPRRPTGRFGDERVSSGGFRFSMVGKVVHAVIADLAAIPEGPTRDDVLDRLTQRVPPDAGNIAFRRQIRAMALTMIPIYFRRFRDPDLTLMGTESSQHDMRMDLVWRTPKGRVLIDEIKTSEVSSIRFLANDQLLKYIRASARRYGEAFYGVRVCFLRSPAYSATFVPGSSRPVVRGTSYE